MEAFILQVGGDFSPLQNLRLHLEVSIDWKTQSSELPERRRSLRHLRRWNHVLDVLCGRQNSMTVFHHVILKLQFQSTELSLLRQTVFDWVFSDFGCDSDDDFTVIIFTQVDSTGSNDPIA